ncbi:MAG: restriction endonuclease subunit S [Oscillospiraceae bacterium]|nr:restriction endonuclease subunit S [Oscillospiraceae bacterium]
MNKWHTIRADKFCFDVTDGTHDSPKSQTAGRKLITSKHLKGYYIDFDSANWISEADYQKVITRSRVEQWDILYSMIGTIGNMYLEKNPVIDYACKNMGIFKFNGNISDAYWMYYYLKSPQAIAYINSHLRGSTQSYVPLGGLREMPVPVPPVEIRLGIISILRSIDDKIENNQKINDNLEQQAQAIYTSMFIDNADPAWEQGQLSDLITVKYGKDHKKLADGKYPVFGSGGIMRYVERPLYTGESVLIPRKGTLNNVMYVNEPFWSVDTMFFTEMKIPNVAKFVFHFVKAKDLASMNAGSAVPSMTTDILNAMELSIPSAERLAEFESVVAPMYQAMQANNRESSKLAELRDNLLPKLMSGEVDVSEIRF